MDFIDDGFGLNNKQIAYSSALFKHTLFFILQILFAFSAIFISSFAFYIHIFVSQFTSISMSFLLQLQQQINSFKFSLQA